LLELINVHVSHLTLLHNLGLNVFYRLLNLFLIELLLSVLVLLFELIIPGLSFSQSILQLLPYSRLVLLVVKFDLFFLLFLLLLVLEQLILEHLIFSLGFFLHYLGVLLLQDLALPQLLLITLNLPFSSSVFFIFLVESG